MDIHVFHVMVDACSVSVIFISQWSFFTDLNRDLFAGCLLVLYNFGISGRTIFFFSFSCG